MRRTDDIHTEEDADWADLDGDCYFPPDGYNYEQHLKSVSGTKKALSFSTSFDFF